MKNPILSNILDSYTVSYFDFSGFINSSNKKWYFYELDLNLRINFSECKMRVSPKVTVVEPPDSLTTSAWLWNLWDWESHRAGLSISTSA